MPTSFFNAITTLTKLKQRKRAGWVKRGVNDPESVADHSWRAGIMAYLLAPEGMNKDKLLKMGTLHDISEVFDEDYTPLDGITKEEKEKREKEAVKKFIALLPKKEAEDMRDTWVEFEEKKTPEAQFVKEIEILEMLFQALEYELDKNFEKDLTEFIAYSKSKITHPVLKPYLDEIIKRWPKEALEKFDPTNYKYYY